MNNVGFIKDKQRYCSRDNVEVDDNDGCTLGKKGRPMVGVDEFAQNVIVDIKDHEAVYGEY